jgi:hypothetical protein
MSRSVSKVVPTLNEAPGITALFESIQKPDLRSVSSSNLRAETLTRKPRMAGPDVCDDERGTRSGAAWLTIC